MATTGDRVSLVIALLFVLKIISFRLSDEFIQYVWNMVSRQKWSDIYTISIRTETRLITLHFRDSSAHRHFILHFYRAMLRSKSAVMPHVIRPSVCL